MIGTGETSRDRTGARARFQSIDRRRAQQLLGVLLGIVVIVALTPAVARAHGPVAPIASAYLAVPHQR
ncbi:MAG: hypothetical protein ACRDNK_18340, partial [Solirubrobacteraceae bacterium]